MRRFGQRNALGGFTLCPDAWRHRETSIRAHQREPAEIGNQEAHLLGADHLVQRLRDRFDGLDRRGGLRGVEQAAEHKPGRRPQFYVIARAHQGPAYARLDERRKDELSCD
jgi:hypothetical protein